MSRRYAKWTNGKTVREGWYEFYWPGDFFWVRVGRAAVRKVYGDEPEWGDWRVVREPPPPDPNTTEEVKK